LAARAEAKDDVGILLNNVRTAHRATAEVNTDAKWDKVTPVNLSAPFILTLELDIGSQRQLDCAWVYRN
jgi:NAD(P)-dependent dehydrogenase (short-subunit alcohol dehydrogenase family)